MPAITVRNIPDEIHRGLKALAARHGRSAEAEVRELISKAVQPEGALRAGEAMAAIWKPLRLSAEELEQIGAVRETESAQPMSFDE